MPKPELLLANTNDVPKDRFFVASTKEKIDEGETLMADNADMKFCGGTSLADTLFGWGVVRMIVGAGKQAVLLFRPGQNYKLPGGQDESST